MLKFFCSFFALCLCMQSLCQSLDTISVSSIPAPVVSKAEAYYGKAWNILQNTTNNALSRALSNQALAYVDSAIALDSTQSRYFRVKATSHFHLKQYDLAISNHSKAIQLDSTNALAWMGRAIAYENTTRYPFAEYDYLKALEYDKNPVTIYFNLGLLYGKWGKDSLALLAYDHVIEIDPRKSGAYLNRGQVKLQNKLYTAAVSDFNKVISLDPTDKLAYNNRGLCKYYLKEYEDAIIDLKKALSIKMDDSFYENFDTDQYSYNNIANCYFGLGNRKEACKYWNIAIQKGYKYKKEWKAIYNIDDPNELIKRYCE